MSIYDVPKALLEKFGISGQVDKFIEETSELIEAINEQHDRSHVLEEIVDVYIVMESLKARYNFSSEEIGGMYLEKLRKAATYLCNDQQNNKK